MEDQQIIELYWNRNEEAVAQSAKKYGSYCFTIANNILHNQEDSDECVNDTWFQTWKSVPPKRPGILRMFFAKITRNIAINRWKSNTAGKRGGGQMTLVLDELRECLVDYDEAEDPVINQMIAKELGQTIGTFVKNLPVQEGDIFIRRYFYLESIKDIAENFGLTPNHTAVLLNRTRNKLRDQLKKEGYLYE